MSLKGGQGYYVAFYLLLLVMFVLLCVCVSRGTRTKEKVTSN